jgi:hypothetical protein
MQRLRALKQSLQQSMARGSEPSSKTCCPSCCCYEIGLGQRQYGQRLFRLYQAKLRAEGPIEKDYSTESRVLRDTPR